MPVLNRPQRTDGFKLEPLDDELLLYHPDQNRAVYMNETASLIWSLCDGRTLSAIVDEVGAAYPEAVESLADEVRATIEQLAAVGALRES